VNVRTNHPIGGRCFRVRPLASPSIAGLLVAASLAWAQGIPAPAVSPSVPLRNGPGPERDECDELAFAALSDPAVRDGSGHRPNERLRVAAGRRVQFGGGRRAADDQLSSAGPLDKTGSATEQPVP
jgi:hypothetical protein